MKKKFSLEKFIMNDICSDEDCTVMTELMESEEYKEPIEHFATGVAAVAYARGVKDVICKEAMIAGEVTGVILAVKFLTKVLK